MNRNQKIFLWFVVISCIISFMSTFSLYHFPGERSIILILTFVLGLSNIGGMMEKQYVSLAFMFAILSIVAMILPLINGTMPDFKSMTGITFGLFFILLKNKYKFFVLDKTILILSTLLLLSIIEFYLITFFGIGIKLGVVQRGDTAFLFDKSRRSPFSIFL